MMIGFSLLAWFFTPEEIVRSRKYDFASIDDNKDSLTMMMARVLVHERVVDRVVGNAGFMHGNTSLFTEGYHCTSLSELV